MTHNGSDKMINAKKSICYALFVPFALCAAAVFAGGKPELVNERSFTLEGITTISIDYGSGAVVFMEGTDNALMFREYLSVDKRQYYANSSAAGGPVGGPVGGTAGGTITIETGKRPWFRHLRARLEVYIPRLFEGDYRVSVGSGSVAAETDMSASGEVLCAVSSGTTRLQNIRGRSIKLRAQSGSIHAADLYGDTDVRISSGSLRVAGMYGAAHELGLSSGSAEIAAASGGGRFSASSGKIRIGIRELSGDLAFDISSGSLDLALPHNAAFYLDAETSSGTVTVESADGSFSVKNRSSVLRPVGDNPEHTVRAEVSSGNITVTR
jgi:hypothetical protein